ncbi:histidine kinase [[Actinomadura] parvosata]|uniref:histidine kinase n=1 Tax=[Actinomadura] parvosata TaxID=1955412 RepID=UPI00406CDF36
MIRTPPAPAAATRPLAGRLAAQALRTLAGPADLLLNAATGVAALALLALVAVCAALRPLTGSRTAPLDRALGLAHRLAAFHRRRADHTLRRDARTRDRHDRSRAPDARSDSRDTRTSARNAHPNDRDTRAGRRNAHSDGRDTRTSGRNARSHGRDVHSDGRDVRAGGGVRSDGWGEVGGGRRRVLLWLAVQSVAGPAPLVVAWGMLAALDYVLFRLNPVERSTFNTFALSLSIVAIAVVLLLSVALFRAGQARLARLLLAPAPTPDARIRELTASRAALVDARDAELRRIERDLHDGAQAKLIAIRMQLGLARGSRDPHETLRMIDEAREVAGQALTDLRDLVRGIHPPVLADRGLTGAIEASALLCPMPVELDLDLPGRLQPPVESAVYFAVAEALTNVTKHSGASRAWVRLRHASGVLRLAVGDDGRGGANAGARPGAGAGLRGIRDRLSAFDGSLTVSSPPGGPTELTMELPCALSSPKISHS